MAKEDFIADHYDDVSSAVGTLNNAFIEIAQYRTDLQEKYDNMSDTAKESDRGIRVEAQLEELNFMEDFDEWTTFEDWSNGILQIKERIDAEKAAKKTAAAKKKATEETATTTPG
jgi:hypothetical protein